MSINEQVAGLSQVLSGWDTSAWIAVTIGATFVRVYPDPRMSVAEYMLKVVRSAEATHGIDFDVWATSAGKVAIYGASAFDVTVASAHRTRTGFTTGTYSGASEYTADAAHEGGAYPTLGVGLKIGAWSVNEGGVTASGGLGWAGSRSAPSGSMRCYGTYSEINTLEGTLDTGKTWDVWRGGRVLRRVRLGAVRRDRWGKAAQEAVLRVDAQEVRL